jgi:hypothetical protein
VSRVRVRAEGDPSGPATVTYLEAVVTSGRIGDGEPQVAGPPLPAPTFDLSSIRSGWVPTLQLSVFLRAEPAPGRC